MPIRFLTILSFVLLASLSCNSATEKLDKDEKDPSKSNVIEEPDPTAAPTSSADSEIEIYNSFEEFEHLLYKDTDSTYVINFWATWCKPCVQELPLFEKLTEMHKDKPYKTILVSLDFPKQIESKLIPFIEKNKLKSEVVVLTDKKQQVWIDKVDKKWDGAIPVTLIYKKDKRKFLYGEVHDFEELNGHVTGLLNL